MHAISSYRGLTDPQTNKHTDGGDYNTLRRSSLARSVITLDFCSSDDELNSCPWGNQVRGTLISVCFLDLSWDSVLNVSAVIHCLLLGIYLLCYSLLLYFHML